MDPTEATGTEPPQSSEEAAAEFERTMLDIEGNDDMDTKMIMEQTGAKEVKPETGPAPGSTPDKPPAEDEQEKEAKPEGEEKEVEKEPEKPAEPPPQDGEERLAKLRKKGRQVGEGQYQVNQGMAELKAQRAEFAQQQAETQQLAHEAYTLIESFKRDPLNTMKKYDVDPVAAGRQIKEALANPDAHRAKTETSDLGSRLERIEQLLTAKNEEQQLVDQQRAHAEAVERDHQTLKAYMSEDSAKMAYPLTARLQEAVFRRESERAAAWLLQEGLDVSQDNVCEVIESNLENLRSVYTDTPAPTTEKRAEPDGSAPPTGQRSAPSLGADEKTSGPAGPDWDTLSLGDADDPDFLEKLEREVASG